MGLRDKVREEYERIRAGLNLEPGTQYWNGEETLMAVRDHRARLVAEEQGVFDEMIVSDVKTGSRRERIYAISVCGVAQISGSAPTLLELLQSSARDERNAAIYSLGTLRCAEAYEAIEKLGPPDYNSVRSLARIDFHRAKSYLDQLVQSGKSHELGFIFLDRMKQVGSRKFLADLRAFKASEPVMAALDVCLQHYPALPMEKDAYLSQAAEALK
jgi:hypothetical protein